MAFPNRTKSEGKRRAMFDPELRSMSKQEGQYMDKMGWTPDRIRRWKKIRMMNQKRKQALGVQ